MSLKHNLIANYFGQGWVSLMGLAFVPMYIHYLGLEAFGMIGLYAVIQAWFVFLDMGLSPTITREMTRFTVGVNSPKYIYDLLRSLEITTLTFAIVMGMVIWSASDYLAIEWLKAKDLSLSVVAESLSIMSIVVALRFCEGIYRGALLGLQMQVWFNVVNAILATLRHVGSLGVIAFVSPTLKAFFIWQAIISILTVTVLAARVYKVLPKIKYSSMFRISVLVDVWQFAGGMMSISFMSILLTQLDKILLSRTLSLDNFGAYMLAATIASILYATIIPVTQAFYPRMIELVSRDDRKALIKIYHLGAQTITVLTAPIALVLFFFGGKVIHLWSGDDMLAKNVSLVLAPLVLGTFLNGLMHIPFQLQIAHGWTGFTIKVNIIAVAILTPALFWVIPRYGSNGAAWIWVVLNLGYILLSIHFMHRRLLGTEKRLWYFQDVIFPITGAMVVVLLFKIFIASDDYGSRFCELILLIIAGVLSAIAAGLLAPQIRTKIYATTLFILKPILMKDLKK